MDCPSFFFCTLCGVKVEGSSSLTSLSQKEVEECDNLLNNDDNNRLRVPSLSGSLICVSSCLPGIKNLIDLGVRLRGLQAEIEEEVGRIREGILQWGGSYEEGGIKIKEELGEEEEFVDDLTPFPSPGTIGEEEEDDEEEEEDPNFSSSFIISPIPDQEDDADVDCEAIRRHPAPPPVEGNGRRQSERTSKTAALKRISTWENEEDDDKNKEHKKSKAEVDSSSEDEDDDDDKSERSESNYNSDEELTYRPPRPRKTRTANDKSDPTDTDKDEDGRKFACSRCGKKFSTLGILKDHELRHDRPFPCKYCRKRFGAKRDLNRHVVSIHERDKLATDACPYCNKLFGRRDHLVQHVRAKHDKTFVYVKKKELKNKTTYENDTGSKQDPEETGNETEALSPRPRPHECRECGKTFSRIENLTAHIKIHHDPSKGLICLKCGATFALPTDKFIHERLVHKGLPIFTCPDSGCGKTFGRKKDYNRHINGALHNNANRRDDNLRNLDYFLKGKGTADLEQINPPDGTGLENDKQEDSSSKNAEYLCESCGKTFIGRKAKMRHDYRCHSKNGETFHCDLCNTELPSKFRFKKHLEGIYHRRKVMEKEGLDSIPEPKKKYTCATCGKSSKSYDAHRYHMFKAHVEIPDPDTQPEDYEFTCPHPQCGKKYASEKDLYIHSRSHRRNFSCETCGKSFSQTKDLNRHILAVHEPEKRERLECPHSHCDKSFTRQSTLDLHLQRIHDPMQNLICTPCQIQFRTFSEKEVHDRVVHKGGSVFTCSECGKMYPWKNDLRKHVGIHHKKEQSSQPSD